MKLYFIRNQNNNFLLNATGDFYFNMEYALYYNKLGPARSAVSWQFNNKGIICDILEFTLNIDQAKVLKEES